MQIKELYNKTLNIMSKYGLITELIMSDELLFNYSNFINKISKTKPEIKVISAKKSTSLDYYLIQLDYEGMIGTNQGLILKEVREKTDFEFNLTSETDTLMFSVINKTQSLFMKKKQLFIDEKHDIYSITTIPEYFEEIISKSFNDNELTQEINDLYNLLLK